MDTTLSKKVIEFATVLTENNQEEFYKLYVFDDIDYFTKEINVPLEFPLFGSDESILQKLNPNYDYLSNPLTDDFEFYQLEKEVNGKEIVISEPEIHDIYPIFDFLLDLGERKRKIVDMSMEAHLMMWHHLSLYLTEKGSYQEIKFERNHIGIEEYLRYCEQQNINFNTIRQYYRNVYLINVKNKYDEIKLINQIEKMDNVKDLNEIFKNEVSKEIKARDNIIYAIMFHPKCSIDILNQAKDLYKDRYISKVAQKILQNRKISDYLNEHCTINKTKYDISTFVELVKSVNNTYNDVEIEKLMSFLCNGLNKNYISFENLEDSYTSEVYKGYKENDYTYIDEFIDDIELDDEDDEIEL